MFKKFLRLLAILVLILLALIIVNTFRNHPWPERPANANISALPDSAVRHLSEAVQIPTISISDTSKIDTSAFLAFKNFLAKSYPLIRQNLTLNMAREFSYIFEWKGQNPQLQPIILMGHYDVVPVEEATIGKWQVAPFSGAISDTCVWGRGSVDDKAGVISILEAVESMLRQGFHPKRTIYLCFGHDEEIGGRGAKAIVDELSQKNIRPQMVLDEGGEISESKIKDVKRPVAVIGVGEKGYATYELSVEKEGGHSSKPEKESAIDILVAALAKLKNHPTPPRITPPVREFLHRVGSSSDNFVNKMASSNMWLFEGIAKGIIESKPEGNAMIHTTITPTILQSGIKDNVIPSRAEAIINSRILPGETSETVAKYIADAIHDSRVVIKKISVFESDPSPSTSMESPAFKRVENAIYENMPHVIPTPYLMIGATDSRRYRAISDGVVNFLPMIDSKGYHGINERLPIADLQRSINFMMTIIRESDSEF